MLHINNFYENCTYLFKEIMKAYSTELYTNGWAIPVIVKSMKRKRQTRRNKRAKA